MLKQLSYSEYAGTDRAWKLNPVDLVQKNLVVGQNATGKSRMISVISGFCQMLSGKRVDPFESCEYTAELEIAGTLIKVSFAFSDIGVASERLEVDGELRLERNNEGKGQIWYEKERKYLEIQVPPRVLALRARQDSLQHPFLEHLSAWAQKMAFFAFGSPLGKSVVTQLLPSNAIGSRADAINPIALDQSVQEIYRVGFARHGEKFDKAIIRDMKAMGYNIKEVGIGDVSTLAPHVRITGQGPFLVLFVKESDRNANVIALDMSQGMYRALAMVVCLNAAALEKFEGLVLVDDIGEGLDYDRSTNLIKLLFRHIRPGMQIIATTNDRFVMNAVPLDNWCVLKRKGGVVSAFTPRNSPKEFESFKFVGLNNFEFFRSNKLH